MAKLPIFIGGGTPRISADRIVIDKEFKADTVEGVFLFYREELISSLRESLTSIDKEGELSKSIDAKVVVSSNKVSFELQMNHYWKFVDEGVDGTQQSRGSRFKFKKNGKRIPLEAMKKFIARRGMMPKSISKLSKKVRKTVKKIDKQKALDSFAWAIGVNIKKKGLEATHFFTDVINDDLKTRMTADISKALKRDIELDFTT